MTKERESILTAQFFFLFFFFGVFGFSFDHVINTSVHNLMTFILSRISIEVHGE